MTPPSSGNGQGEFYFDERAAEAAVRFFERLLVHVKGEWAGERNARRALESLPLRSRDEMMCIGPERKVRGYYQTSVLLPVGLSDRWRCGVKREAA